MKKIYIIGPSFISYFSYKVVAGGGEKSTLDQFNVLKEQYNVRLFTPTGDIHKFIENIDYYLDKKLTKEGEKEHRKNIIKKLIFSITKNKPDVILINMYFKNWLFKELVKLDIPILYLCHNRPGGISDVSANSKLHNFLQYGHSMSCVSEYHKEKLIFYYSRPNDPNMFDIIPDHILPSSYCEREKIVSAKNIVRHISRASKLKSTFLLHDVLSETDIPSEVITQTDGAMDSWGKIKDENLIYVKNNLDKYNEYPRKTYVNIEHNKTMELIKDSGCMFVGLAPYDTFTITSLEALSRGIPLIVKGKDVHPAQEMVTDDYKKYVHIFKDKNDFIEKVKEFNLLSLEKRQNISDSCYSKMSKEKYFKKLEYVLESTIVKYKKHPKGKLEFVS
tara:strand:- start:79 stop:1248 length:1170 start_codon:yes stop_codon:yes gene_type:complete